MRSLEIRYYTEGECSAIHQIEICETEAGDYAFVNAKGLVAEHLYYEDAEFDMNVTHDKYVSNGWQHIGTVVELLSSEVIDDLCAA